MEIKYPHAKILGHKDTGNTNKTCPNFDVIKHGLKISFYEYYKVISML